MSAFGADLLRPYVDQGFSFVALRLAPNRDVDDLQPIALSYAAANPAIPIRLTAVATEPDLDVLVWILGPARAVPVNYDVPGETLERFLENEAPPLITFDHVQQLDDGGSSGVQGGVPDHVRPVILDFGHRVHLLCQSDDEAHRLRPG